jgi:putative spermidine/putrescine transport system substrate-binding protein
MKRIRKRHAIAAALAAGLAAGLVVPAVGVGAKQGRGSERAGGTLKMIEWDGYLDPKWINSFQKQSGCTILPKVATTSDEMFALMRTGGGTQYDMVSASGDASLRLIYAGLVQPVDVSKVPQWKQFWGPFKSPPNNTVKGKHYGISLQFGPNTLLYRTDKVHPAPTSWSVIYSQKYKGRITVPDNPIQIADAALYLMKTQRSLGIFDPYELNSKQFAAAVALLKKQRPLIKKYWSGSADNAALIASGDAWLGPTWPITTGSLEAKKVPVKELIPKEGATSWLDTWMLSAKSKNVDCAYKWYRYISSPKVQALQGVTWGETPVNKKACPYMNKLSAGSCNVYHANEPISYYKSLYFWKTPVAACGNGKNDCMDYSKWVDAWTKIKAS